MKNQPANKVSGFWLHSEKLKNIPEKGSGKAAKKTAGMQSSDAQLQGLSTFFTPWTPNEKVC